MSGYRLTPRARTGLRSILEYVGDRFGVGVAERVLDKLEAAFEMLSENPGIGHRREDLTEQDQVKFWTVGPTLVAYRCVPDVVEVLLVARGGRDWERLLETDF